MSGITAGELRLTGGPGFSQILDFSMREYPGEHSRAELTGIIEVSKGGTSGFPWLEENSPVEIHVDGMERALYSGIIQKAESREENGYCLLRLALCSGSILLDLKKEKRSFQDVSMTCGQIIRKAAAESGITVLCPEELDGKPVGFPVIQYRETDWEFIRRLASRHGLPVYPEPTMGGGKLCVGLPETGTMRPMSCLGHTTRMDRKFYQAGGEQEGRDRRQYQIYEVRSLDLFRVGDLAEWDGKQLPVCVREARMQGGHLEFTYVLADRSWTWQRRLGNPKISGMSLLGTVKKCAGETVQLELDIDSGRPGQPCYPWTWVPTTGNLMYMMPQAGTRVSLYFKEDEEESAIAVNCIRSGEGCKEADPLDKSLITEHGMQMRLCQCDMGVVTLKEKVLLDDLTGIRMEGSGGLHIVADGEVKLEGQEVNLNGNKGVTMYEGKAVLDLEKLLDAEDGAVLPEVVVTAAGKVELSTEEGEDTVQNRGEKVTYYLAWEHADLSHPSNRYRDEPEQKDYDWAQWRLNIAAGIVVVGGAAILGATIAGAAAGAGMIAAGNISAGSAAASAGGAVFLTGSLYVAEQAVSDAVSGRLGDTEKYVRKALAGSVVGFLTGASGLMMQGASLGKVLSLGFGEGFLGSAAAQGLLNEDGEINWALAIGDGMFSAVMAGLVWKKGGNRTTETVEERRKIYAAKLGEFELNTSNVTREWIIEQLDEKTIQSTKIARLLKSRDLKINVLGKELYEQVVPVDAVNSVACFERGYLYLRRDSKTLLSDIVHEGTHAIDMKEYYGYDFLKSRWSWKKELSFMKGSSKSVWEWNWNMKLLMRCWYIYGEAMIMNFIIHIKIEKNESLERNQYDRIAKRFV